jgi:hypothetical protein
LISGVMTGVTAGAMGFIGAAAVLIAGFARFAAFFAGFFLAAFLAGRFFAFFADFFFEAFFLAVLFLATRFFEARFLEDFFFAFFADFFFAAFFFAAMFNSFSMLDRSIVVRPIVLPALPSSDSHRMQLVRRLYAHRQLSRLTI